MVLERRSEDSSRIDAEESIIPVQAPEVDAMESIVVLIDSQVTNFEIVSLTLWLRAFWRCLFPVSGFSVSVIGRTTVWAWSSCSLVCVSLCLRSHQLGKEHKKEQNVVL